MSQPEDAGLPAARSMDNEDTSTTSSPQSIPSDPFSELDDGDSPIPTLMTDNEEQFLFETEEEEETAGSLTPLQLPSPISPLDHLELGDHDLSEFPLPPISEEIEMEDSDDATPKEEGPSDLDHEGTEAAAAAAARAGAWRRKRALTEGEDYDRAPSDYTRPEDNNEVVAELLMDLTIDSNSRNPSESENFDARPRPRHRRTTV